MGLQTFDYLSSATALKKPCSAPRSRKPTFPESFEALASGVPAIVTPGGGPKYIVREAETGFITSDAGFTSAIAMLANDRDRLGEMRTAARAYALTCSWDAVFDRVYAGYQDALA
jgi:glycosyltransferase involved in cell wall biosynthesis